MDRVRQLLGLPDDLQGDGVRIAVLDTGIDADHPDLSQCWCQDHSTSLLFDAEMRDPHGHGTHICGLIAGSGEISNGRYRGVAPAAELVVFRVAEEQGSAKQLTVARAVEMAVDADVDIINYSASTDGYRLAGGPPPWRWSRKLRAIDEQFVWAVTEKGVLCVAAAGNSGPGRYSVEPPGLLQDVLAVGAVGWDGEVAPGSSRGPVCFDPDLDKGAVRAGDEDQLEAADYVKPDVMTPGGNVPRVPSKYPVDWIRRGVLADAGGVISTRSGSCSRHPISLSEEGYHYCAIAGTSQATAIASGLAALAIEYADHVGLEWGERKGLSIRNLMRHAARKPRGGGDVDYGHGILTWASLRDAIDSCVEDSGIKEFALGGGQLKLMP